ncbi:L-aspartate oxidase [Caldisalinibacter kiritimatiensis]|uniref:L-aspartate oxidase n=1 Tax=Caldisalinibacter kiritimatiensis TaxID=1304284 RepID=R1AST1_9FIRM|nr:L-aspartate oxidase [Caldisalinibacter kiritimatiensis]EOD00213.1 L-aspartate oxidase [Caldisalinibacter kiritimatiensis]
MLKDYYDVIIVGSGLAGLYTALNLNKELRIAILSKGEMSESNSNLAQGGIAACIKDDDDFSYHIEDALIAGSHLNDKEKLETMIQEAPQNIKNLIELGVNFDKDSDGNIMTTMEGGHSKRRVLHAGGDATGKEIMKALKEEVTKMHNITVWENTFAVDIIKKDDICVGLQVICNRKTYNLFSKFVVLATGGIGSLYKDSTNPTIATGDGIAIGYRAGCILNDMEFIQFHPTALYTKNEGKKFLISEAVRGEGAFLRNKYGERFMLNIHPKGELASRDIVSQNIYKEMRDTNSEYVYIDITHKDKDYLQNRFPNIYKKCLENGFDMSKDYIPVIPVEHYFIGGIVTDINGRTNIENLYACGECANTGVHGANRLASNSLLECIVFGKRIANHINFNKDNVQVQEVNKTDEVNIKKRKVDNIVEDIKYLVRNIMSDYVGIVRTEVGLIKANEIITRMLEAISNKRNYSIDYLEVINMLTVVKLIIDSSLKRKESIGCYKIENI